MSSISRIDAVVGGQRQRRCPARREAGAEQRPDGHRIAEQEREHEATTMVRVLDQCKAVPITIPSTSPIPHPVRQWIVAGAPAG
jgi:hypothetical protein